MHLCLANVYCANKWGRCCTHFLIIAGVLVGVESIVAPGLRASVARLLKPDEIGEWPIELVKCVGGYYL